MPGSWDEMAWDCVYALLMQDAWLEEYLSSVKDQAENVKRLIKLEQQTILRLFGRLSPTL